MDPQEIIIDEMLMDPGVSSIIGSRIFPALADQGAELPYCSLQVISEVRTYTHCGYSRIKRNRIQINLYIQPGNPSGYGQLQSLKDAIIELMESLAGGSYIKNSRMESFNEMIDPETRAFVGRMDWIIDFDE